jgi:hypothetical protein
VIKLLKFFKHLEKLRLLPLKLGFKLASLLRIVKLIISRRLNRCALTFSANRNYVFNRTVKPLVNMSFS